MNEKMSSYPQATPAKPLPSLQVMDSLAGDIGGRAHVLKQELAGLAQFLGAPDRVLAGNKAAADIPPGKIPFFCASLEETSEELYNCLTLVRALKEVLSAPDPGSQGEASVTRLLKNRA